MSRAVNPVRALVTFTNIWLNTAHADGLYDKANILKDQPLDQVAYEILVQHLPSTTTMGWTKLYAINVWKPSDKKSILPLFLQCYLVQPVLPGSNVPQPLKQCNGKAKDPSFAGFPASFDSAVKLVILAFHITILVLPIPTMATILRDASAL